MLFHFAFLCVASFVRRKWSFANYIHISVGPLTVNIYSMTWHMTILPHWYYIYSGLFMLCEYVETSRRLYTNTNAFGNFAWVFPFVNVKTSHTFHTQCVNEGATFFEKWFWCRPWFVYYFSLNFQLENYY